MQNLNLWRNTKITDEEIKNMVQMQMLDLDENNNITYLGIKNMSQKVDSKFLRHKMVGNQMYTRNRKLHDNNKIFDGEKISIFLILLFMYFIY
jgi:hypothetical protein